MAGKLTIQHFIDEQEAKAAREREWQDRREEQLRALGELIDALAITPRQRRRFSIGRFLDWWALG